MVDFNSMENIQLLLSHADLYAESRTIDEIVQGEVGVELLSFLSFLAFSKDEEKKFRRWAESNIAAVAHKSEYAKERAVYSHIKILECWKVLLRKLDDKVSECSSTARLAILHELFAKLNDDDVNGDLHQLFIKGAISNARDDYWFKFYRAQEIFLDGEKLIPYRRQFEQYYGFDLESYLNVIFMLITRCHNVLSGNTFDPELLQKWTINLDDASNETGVNVELLVKIMGSISFSFSEGRDFSHEAREKKNDFSLFRDRPFLRLSEKTYLPIEGKLVEELLFDNLFHKIHFTSGKNNRYLNEFGGQFEKYVQDLIEEFCSTNNLVKYESIPEFSFGKSNAKSPDAMIFCKRNKNLLAVEVKSARYLDTIVSTEECPEAIENSFQKLKYGPWEQAYNSIAKIVHEKRHPKIVEGLSFLFLCVTMNEIPLSLQDHQILVNGTDASDRFHALSIHAFELLLTSVNKSSDYTSYDILMSTYAARRKISAKTLILRFDKSIQTTSNFYLRLASRMFDRHKAYLEK